LKDGGQRSDWQRSPTKSKKEKAAPDEAALEFQMLAEWRSAGSAFGAGPAGSIDSAADVVEDFLSPELGDAFHFVFDAHELVVLGDAVGAGHGAGFDLAVSMATVKSAMKVSSVSPERWETTAV